VRSKLITTDAKTTKTTTTNDDDDEDDDDARVLSFHMRSTTESESDRSVDEFSSKINCASSVTIDGDNFPQFPIG